MSKKTLSIVLIIFIAALAAGAWALGRGQGRLGSAVVDADAAQSLMSERVPAEGIVPDIYFDEEKIFFDPSSDTYFYSLVEGSPSAYNPRIRASIGGEKAKVCLVGSGISKELMASGSAVDMLVCTEQSYFECKLICTNLPLLNIDTDPDVGEEDQSMYLTVFDNGEDAAFRLTTSDGYIRYRGGMSKAFPKKSFKLTLKTESVGGSTRKNKVSLLGMRQDEDWILNSLYNDYEKVRNAFNHNLWTESCGTDNEFNIQTGIEYKYVEVFVNGEYWGLYTLGYLPDEKTLSSRSMTEDEGLYKKRIYRVSGYRSDDYAFDQLYDYYTNFEEARGDAETLKSLVDVDNCIDFNLFTTMTQGIDNIEHNYYLLLRNIEGRQVGIMVPWDLDLTWGYEWTYGDPNHTSYYSITEDTNLLFTEDPVYELLAENDEDTYNRMFEKYRELRAGGWSDKRLGELIDGYEEDIFGSGAYYRDKERWPEGNYADGISSLDTFREFVSKRMSVMDSFMDRLENERTDNQFINQCLKYENLEGSVFVVEIRDKAVLEDPEYVEFFEWLGIDVSKISEDCGYVVCEYGGKRVEYVDSSFTKDEEYVTELGTLRFWGDPEFEYNYEDDYTVSLDDADCFVSSASAWQNVRAACVVNGKGDELYMKSAYKVEADYWDLPNDDIWLRFIDNLNGNAIFRINDTRSDEFDRDTLLKGFDLDLAGYGSLEEALDDNDYLVFLLDCRHERGYLIPDGYVNGTYVETPIGSYAYYEGDTDFGIYINGEDKVTGTVGNYGAAVMVAAFDIDWQ